MDYIYTAIIKKLVMQNPSYIILEFQFYTQLIYLSKGLQILYNFSAKTEFLHTIFGIENMLKGQKPTCPLVVIVHRRTCPRRPIRIERDEFLCINLLTKVMF